VFYGSFDLKTYRNDFIMRDRVPFAFRYFHSSSLKNIYLPSIPIIANLLIFVLNSMEQRT
jgi:hypothetical protein